MLITRHLPTIGSNDPPPPPTPTAATDSGVWKQSGWFPRTNHAGGAVGHAGVANEQQMCAASDDRGVASRGPPPAERRRTTDDAVSPLPPPTAGVSPSEFRRCQRSIVDRRRRRAKRRAPQLRSGNLPGSDNKKAINYSSRFSNNDTTSWFHWSAGGWLIGQRRAPRAPSLIRARRLRTATTAEEREG